jgi:peptidase C13-like protein
MKIFIIIVCVIFCISNINIAYSQKDTLREKITELFEKLEEVKSRSPQKQDTIAEDFDRMETFNISKEDSDELNKMVEFFKKLIDARSKSPQKQDTIAEDFDRKEIFELYKKFSDSKFKSPKQYIEKNFFLLGIYKNILSIYKTKDFKVFINIINPSLNVVKDSLDIIEFESKRLEFVDSSYVNSITPFLLSNFMNFVAIESNQRKFLDEKPSVYHSYLFKGLLHALSYGVQTKNFSMFKQLLKYTYNENNEPFVTIREGYKHILFILSGDIRDMEISMEGLLYLSKETKLTLTGLIKIVSYEIMGEIEDNYNTPLYSQFDSILINRIENQTLLSPVIKGSPALSYLLHEYILQNTNKKILLDYSTKFQKTTLSTEVIGRENNIWYEYLLKKYKKKDIKDIRYNLKAIALDVVSMSIISDKLYGSYIAEYCAFYLLQEMADDSYSAVELVKTIKELRDSFTIDISLDMNVRLILNVLEKKLLYEASMQKKKKVAYFFAINKFRNHIDLKYPIQNAENIAGILEDKYGYETQIFSNISKKTFEKEWFNIQERHKNDEVIIYIASHGAERDDGEFVLVFNDTDKENKEGKRFRYLTSDYEYIGIERSLLIVDACYSGSIHKDKLLEYSKKRSINAGTKEELKNKSKVVDYKIQFQNYNQNKDEEFNGIITSGIKIEEVNDKSQLALELKNFLKNENEYNINFDKLRIVLEENEIATFQPKPFNFSIWNEYNDERKKNSYKAK